MAVTEQALQLLKARYFLKDEKGTPVEDEPALWLRLSKAIAAAEPTKKREQCQQEFYDVLSTTMFLPNSPTIMNAGKRGGQLAGCFVVPVEDDITAIFNAVKFAALIQSSL